MHHKTQIQPCKKHVRQSNDLSEHKCYKLSIILNFIIHSVTAKSFFILKFKKLRKGLTIFISFRITFYFVEFLKQIWFYNTFPMARVALFSGLAWNWNNNFLPSAYPFQHNSFHLNIIIVNKLKIIKFYYLLKFAIYKLTPFYSNWIALFVVSRFIIDMSWRLFHFIHFE